MRSGLVGRLSKASALIAIVTLAAACGSGSKASSNKSQPTGSASNNGQGAFGDVAGYLNVPTALPVSTQVSKKIPAGAKIVFIAEPYSQSLDLATGLEAAAGVLGWTVQVMKYDPSNPPTFTTSLNSAIAEKPTAIVITGALNQQFAAQVPVALRDHIPLIPVITPDIMQQPAQGLYPVLNSKAELGYQAKMITDTLLSDASKSGQTAHILQVTVPGVAAYISVEDSVGASEVAAKCGQCSRAQIGISLTDLFSGQFTQQVVSYLQSHPDINYVIADSGQVGDGLAAALQRAGINRVKVYGIAATNIQIAAIKSGSPEVWSVQPFVEDGWIIADQVARVLVGDPTDLWVNEHLAYVVKSSNVPDVTNPDTVAMPAGYQAQFKQMWGK